MKKYLKKIDLDQIKEFLFQHGEKVALATCIVLSLTFASLGFLRALSAGKDSTSGHSWIKELSSQSQAITSSMDQAQPAPLDKTTEERLDEGRYNWGPWNSKYITNPYLWLSDKFTSNKRENPVPMTVISGSKTMQLDYIRAPIFTYEYDANQHVVKGLQDNNGKEKIVDKFNTAAPTTLPAMVRAVKPQRFVVGTAIYPMKQQMEEYVRALRMKGQSELLNSPEDLPQFWGINVVRYEVLPGNKLGKGEIVVYAEPQNNSNKSMPKMSDSLRTLLREAIYDESAAEALEPYAFEGLIMPMPKIASGFYPKIDLEDIVVDFSEVVVDPKKPGTFPKKGMPVVNPMNPGTGVKIGGKEKFIPKEVGKKENEPNVLPEMNIVDIPQKDLKAVDPALFNRLFKNDFNVFHVLGMFQPKVDEKSLMPQTQPNLGILSNKGQGRFFSPFGMKEGTGAGAMKDPKDMRVKKPMGRETTPIDSVGQPGTTIEWENDALVRFIDTDIEPGKTYQYAIHVRLKNPNFGKMDEVQFHALAKQEELPDPRDAAKYWVTTPSITIPYEYSIYAVDQPLLDAWSAGKPAVAHDTKTIKDSTSFQVHQWIRKKADLASGEEYVIGDWAIAEHLMVRKGDYIGMNAIVQVPVWKKTKDAYEVPERVKDPKSKTMKPGIKMDLMPPSSNENAMPPVLVDFFGGKRLKGTVVEEETAVDALVLSANGKLMVFNSRDDSDISRPAAKERQERVLTMRRRINEVMGRSDPAMK